MSLLNDYPVARAEGRIGASAHSHRAFVSTVVVIDGRPVSPACTSGSNSQERIAVSDRFGKHCSGARELYRMGKNTSDGTKMTATTSGQSLPGVHLWLVLAQQTRLKRIWKSIRRGHARYLLGLLPSRLLFHGLASRYTVPLQYPRARSLRGRRLLTPWHKGLVPGMRMQSSSQNSPTG